MAGYAKVVPEILDSSLWDERPLVRLVFIGLLVMCDQHGLISTTKRALPRRLNLPDEDVEDALATLAAPDPESKDPDHDGARIRWVEGGLEVLNYVKYREDGRRASHAAYMRDYRARQKEGGGEEHAAGDAPRSNGRSGGGGGSRARRPRQAPPKEARVDGGDQPSDEGFGSHAPEREEARHMNLVARLNAAAMAAAKQTGRKIGEVLEVYIGEKALKDFKGDDDELAHAVNRLELDLKALIAQQEEDAAGESSEEMPELPPDPERDTEGAPF